MTLLALQRLECSTKIIQLSRQLINIFLARNTHATEGGSNALVEYFFNLAEATAGLFLHLFLEGFDAAVGGFNLAGDQFLALFLDGFAFAYQRLEIVRTFFTGLGLGTQACQPDLMGVFLHVSSKTSGAFFNFLCGVLGHVRNSSSVDWDTAMDRLPILGDELTQQN